MGFAAHAAARREADRHFVRELGLAVRLVREGATFFLGRGCACALPRNRQRFREWRRRGQQVDVAVDDPSCRLKFGTVLQMYAAFHWLTNAKAEAEAALDVGGAPDPVALLEQVAQGNWGPRHPLDREVWDDETDVGTPREGD